MTADRTGFSAENGVAVGDIPLGNTVHLLYAGCPRCGADCETRESMTDDHGWAWLTWWCPACREEVTEPHLATFPALDALRGRVLGHERRAPFREGGMKP